MFQSVDQVKAYCAKEGIRILDFKVTDLTGRWHHLAIPVERFGDNIMEEGIGFDGSSYGYLTVEKSDMVFIPDLSSAFVDPFCDVPTLSMIGNIYQLNNGLARYVGDPRYIAEKAEAYMISTGIADQNMIGPEFEFHVFDGISFDNKPHHMEVTINSNQAEWNTNEEDGNGYKVAHKGGYHAALPLDQSNDFRSHASLLMEEMGIQVKYHHHEVGGPGQVEIEVELGQMKDMADNTYKTKYILKNLAVEMGKTVTLMPKPMFGEAGNGMHVHMMLWKDGKPLFYEEGGYCDLSQMALYYIGGLLKHAPALLAFTNPSTNSYKRLVPGYEAPVSICFALSNRSAVIRIPGYANKPENKRFEFRSSDATCNPYLAYSAMLMAGLDGIQNKIDPTAEGFGPLDRNIFDMSDEERSTIKALPKSLEEALQALKDDHEFLLKGDVFTTKLINDWILLKEKEYKKVNIIPHPIEFAMYYDL